MSTTATTTCTRDARITRSLLGYGVLAGPLYLAVGLAQALTRDGFDPTRHAWSLLANGEHGWIQVANFLVAGVMTVAGAVGLRRAMAPGPARTWAPALIAGYGLGLFAAGVFRADPAQGFPAGTPETVALSWHGALHFAVGGVGFLCLIAACLVLGGRLARDGEHGLAWFSRVTGVLFFAAFAGIASGSHGPTTLAFVAGVAVVCAWLTTICLHYSRAVARAAATR